MSRFEEILNLDGVLVYKVRGVSMLPMLRQERDLVVISKPDGPLKKYDVALYKRGDAYVLHRVIAVNKDEYLIRGDNTYSLEHVPYSAVLGVLTEFKRNGTTYSVTDRKYVLYSKVWNSLYPLRYAYRRARSFASRAARKLGLRRSCDKRAGEEH